MDDLNLNNQNDDEEDDDFEPEIIMYLPTWFVFYEKFYKARDRRYFI